MPPQMTTRAPGWQEGDIAYGLMQWAQYSIINPDRTSYNFV